MSRHTKSDAKINIFIQFFATNLMLKYIVLMEMTVLNCKTIFISLIKDHQNLNRIQVFLSVIFLNTREFFSINIKNKLNYKDEIKKINFCTLHNCFILFPFSNT